MKILIFFLLTANACSVYKSYRFELQRWCSEEFKIHGLWPECSSSDYPTFCPGPSYNETQIEQLVPRMKEDWSFCSSQNLWQHEWEKHGTCAFSQEGISIFDYFNLTLSLYESVYPSLKSLCPSGKECLIGCYTLNLRKIECL